jgi:hypothetical protein
MVSLVRVMNGMKRGRSDWITISMVEREGCMGEKSDYEHVESNRELEGDRTDARARAKMNLVLRSRTTVATTRSSSTTMVRRSTPTCSNRYQQLPWASVRLQYIIHQRGGALLFAPTL